MRVAHPSAPGPWTRVSPVLARACPFPHRLAVPEGSDAVSGVGCRRPTRKPVRFCRSGTAACFRLLPHSTDGTAVLCVSRLEIGMAELRRCLGILWRIYCGLRIIVNIRRELDHVSTQHGRVPSLGEGSSQGAVKGDGSRVRSRLEPVTHGHNDAYAGRAGTIRIASPSRTGLPPTVQTQSNRARRFAGNNSASVTLAITSSPIRTGPLKFSVCEM
jgi:hypothetical protein